MIGWLIFIVYVVGVVATMWPLISWNIERGRRRQRKLYRSLPEDMDDGDRIFGAVCLAFIWPLSLLPLISWRLWRGIDFGRIMEDDHERVP